MALEQLKRELERFGEQNDGAQHSRGSKMLNITRDTGELLAVLVQTRGAQAVLEIGTSNGYSTLWLAEAVKRLGGRVTTIELDEGKRTMAATNFERAGLLPGLNSWRGRPAACCPACRRRAISSFFWTPIAATTRPGGPRSSACLPLVACWWWTMPSPMRTR